MINKVYLYWTSYENKKYIIAVLQRSGKNYLFKYADEAKIAKEKGCLLPFPYTENVLCFNYLPPFFIQRMLNKQTLDILNIKYNPKDELSILIANNGKRNTDNFTIMPDFEIEREKTL